MPPKKIIISEHSTQSCLLELYSRDNILSTATGFFVSNSDKIFLLTNWHVLSGRKPVTGQPIHSSSATPDMVKIKYFDLSSRRVHTVQQNLVDKDDKPLWFQHPNGQTIDIAAIEISIVGKQEITNTLDLKLADADISPEVGMSVFIIGYPYGKTTTSHLILPIWKTGNIASEPGLDFDDLPAVLIDATTREGMSGSPVLLTTSGPYRSPSDGALKISSRAITKFMGMYSGRLQHFENDDSNLSSELGFVWKPIAITELLTKKSPAEWFKN